MYDSKFKPIALSIFSPLKMYKRINSQDINLCLSDLWKKGKRMEKLKEKSERGKGKSKIKNVTKEKHSFDSGLQQKYLSMLNYGTTPLSALNTPVSF